jgi:hypothetical protein
MIRAALAGFWLVAVTLASTYAGVYLKTRPTTQAAATGHAGKQELKKIKPISVPIISGGVLKGYFSAEFSYLAEAADPHEAGLDPESFIVHEAFRLIYSNNELDFAHLEKPDLEVLTKQLTASVNARLGSNRIKETLVRNVTFVAKDDLSH